MRKFLWDKYGSRKSFQNFIIHRGLIAFRILSGYVTNPILRLTSLWQNFQETALALERLSFLSLKTPKVFQVNATDPKSEAKSNIWDEFDEFTKLSQDLAETTEVLAVSVGTINDLRPALKRVSSGCKACHSKYRE